MLRMVSRLLFKLSGWKLEGDIPEGMDKCVIIVAPHTSNVDYFYGLAISDRLRLPVRYLIKEEWIKKPLLGKLIRDTGGVGVTRSERKNMVAQMADYIKETDRVTLVFPPEGTRKRNPKWKTGFYYVAVQARVPVVFATLDYRYKKVVIGPYFIPSGDFEKDLELVREHYKDATARYPEKFALPLYETTPSRAMVG